MGGSNDQLRWAALAGLLALLLYVSARVFLPFLSAITGAAVLAVAVYPAKTWLLSRFPNRTTAVCTGITSAVFLFVAIPLILCSWLLAREAAHALPIVGQEIREFVQPENWSRQAPWLPAWLLDAFGELNLQTLILENIHELGIRAGHALSSTAKNTAAFLFDWIVFILFLFLFVRDGPNLVDSLAGMLPLSSERKRRILSRARDMVVAAIEGVFVVALVQGSLAIAGFALLSVKFPVLLGVACAIFSPIPFVGSTLVWAPIAIFAALSGDLLRAVLIAGWFSLIVGTSDNIVRPLLIGSQTRIPVALAVVGVLGGLQAFGPMGLFIGPVVIAVGLAVIETIGGNDGNPIR